ncbi:unnamed protein product [Ilex paraguariensis]
MANRDQPVNGQGSKLSLLKDGNLILSDAGRTTIWTTSTNSAQQLHLHDIGNLVLSAYQDDTVLWQSFDSPTNTLLPQQQLTRYTTLISSRSHTNHSSGFYKLFFDNDNMLCLLYDGPEVSSIYWPDPWLLSWETGRTTYNSSKIAVLDSSGYFRSSDSLEFSSADFGLGYQRRLTLDFDGNLRLYSLNDMTGNWTVTWQAMSDPCRVHGVCGPNGICSYGSGAGRGCSCVPGYKVKNPRDWFDGCELEFDFSGEDHSTTFDSVSEVELFGYEYNVFRNSSLENCKALCLQSSTCKGFLIKFEDGTYNCYAKTFLLNGKHSPNLLGTLYVKLNVSRNQFFFSSEAVKEISLNCSGQWTVQLDRTYQRNNENKFLNYMVWFACAVAVVETLCIALVWCLLYRTQKDSGAATQGYVLATNTYIKFTYAELKKATQGFSEEIGRGGAGVVYKGVLSDNRIAAIKRLSEANKGEAEFLAEVSSIGGLHHMNLIEMWGYCAEGKHRLLVYEYMENGSLAENLNSTLSWERRFKIAMGTAKGLAYLHEECLEWVLHCDVKPQNILLDSLYHPKVADFGLSKVLNRGGGYNASFSKMRGTRGYMAPEWVFNLPITSKVDVYSYGIVVLEMISGRSPTGVHAADDEGQNEPGRVVTWVRNMMHGAAAMNSWIQNVVDPRMGGEYDIGKMETLLRVALQCVEEDGDARPTMKQVVEMLLCHENL